MALLLYRLGKFSYQHRRWVVTFWLALLVAVGGSAVAFHGTTSNNFKIPGTETQRVLDELKQELPKSAGGSAPVVFEGSNGAAITDAQKTAISAALKDLSSVDVVESSVDPFTTQAQLDGALATLEANQKKIDDGKAQLAAGQKQLDAAKAQIDAGKAQAAQAQAAGVQIPAAQAAAAAAQLEAAEKQYNDGVAQAKASAQELTDAQSKLDLGKRQQKSSEGMRFVSENGNAAVAQIQFNTSINALTPAQREQVQDVVNKAKSSGVEIYFSKEIVEDVSELFGTAEIVGLAVAALVLLLMLGTLVAAGLPLLMAIIGVGVGVGGTFALTGVIEMSSVSPMLGLMIGLAVGIDYSLFIVNRHRNQLLEGMEMGESIARATGTAGNAVTFAGLTVVIALAALVVPGLPFLAVMGIAAAATVAISVAVAITLTPALLGVIGTKLISKRAWKRREKHLAHTAHHAKDDDGSHGWGGFVTKHPWLSLVVSVIALGLVAIPATQLRLALPDGGTEPADSSAYKAYSTVGQNFGEGMNGPIVLVAKLPSGLSEADAQTKEYNISEVLRTVENVQAAVPVALSEDRTTAVFQIIPKEGPASASTVKVVSDLRAKGTELKSSEDVTIGLTGQTAANVDVSNKLGDALPLYLVIVVGLSLILLMLVFRSIIVPLLATAGFLLSLAAAFGGVVAVYQWGWLGNIFDVHHPGAVLSFLPIILIGVLFGLAMDYQVFIASGMREAYMHGATAQRAVRSGFSHAAKVVTAAAIIMTSVFAGFIFSHLTMVRPMGFAMAFGVLVDAFIVRMTIIPAAMHLLGKAAWWLPKWLERILPDVDVEGAKIVALTSSPAEESAVEESVAAEKDAPAHRR
ncbi:MMPL family transporter [Pseudarthrobacter sp. J1738]|uniref:MMPL family transporter n=1 Tax=Pseudarthrobacter sp. J1738 TaxID=3420446 RepID=UPI003D2DFB05